MGQDGRGHPIGWDQDDGTKEMALNQGIAGIRIRLNQGGVGS